jgi:ribonuclease Y
METVSLLTGAGIGLAAALGLTFLYQWLTGNNARNKAATILKDAERDAGSRIKEAELSIKERQLAAKEKAEAEFNRIRDQLRDQERELDKRQNALEQTAQDLKKQESFVEQTQNRLTSRLESATLREKELTDILERQRKQLHKITGLSVADAEQRLLEITEDNLSREVGARVLKHERMLEETCEQKSREMLLLAMQRFAATYTSDSTTSTVDIPNDEMKGRIIGREGRNIRAFEKETGIDVIIDDTPGVVIVSGFDPVRREIARQSLEKLIGDGRIHPSRIEEVVAETSREMDKFIRDKGREAVQEVNLHNVHDRIVEYLGRLHFRTSYSQNVLSHSKEVAFLSGMIAEMIGLDADTARRCGLLHDIGKAVDHEREGGHPAIGAEILKQFNEKQDVVHAALGHHDEIVIEHPYTVIVATADACSASRPGARRESLERYIKRMEELESIAREFKGVKQAFAIQAGRELRVMVGAQDTDDATAANICRKIANEFEKRLQYPGEIKVTVIRESRFMEIAR